MELATLQRWMLSLISHPEGVVEGMQSSEAQEQLAVSPEEVEEIIQSSSNQSSIERLQVYANAYYSRLIECLQEEFPAMAYVLGEEVFQAFAFQYLQHYPSNSYTLAKLAKNFPKFLHESQPDEESQHPNWADFLVDLATLERTYSEVFDCQGAEGKQTLSIADLSAIPTESWADLILIPIPCLRLLELRFPVHEFASAVRHGQQPTVPPPQTTCLVISRTNYIVRPRTVSQLEYQVLQGLCAGNRLGDVIETLSTSTTSSTEDLSQQLHEWFYRWSQEGFFSSVTLSD